MQVNGSRVEMTTSHCFATQENEGRRTPRVAIVGGRLAGLATCKALTCRGIDCVIFEKKLRLGGLWVNVYPGATVEVRLLLRLFCSAAQSLLQLPARPRTANNFYSVVSVIRKCRSHIGKLQVHKQCFEFPDLRFPPSASLLPTSTEVCEYCDTYGTKWQLWPRIRLSTAVLHISCNACGNTDPSGGFDSFSGEYVDQSTGAAVTETFAHVVHATSLMSSKPFMPEFSGVDKFAGKLLHSSGRQNDDDEFAGKHVMVVGSGKSAQDAALAAVLAKAELQWWHEHCTGRLLICPFALYRALIALNVSG
jgi:cation diffusion facilitator CzcD-associated flavoprotein CzcO